MTENRTYRTRGALLAAAALAGFAALVSAGPNRYGHSDRVERHMLPAVSTGPQDPAWSPDAQWIAFSMRGDIWKVPAAGGVAIALTQGPGYHFEPAWSPDGQRVALSFDAGDGNLDVGIVDADGGAVQRVTTGAQVDVQPEWGADGHTLYYVSAQGGRFRIHRRDLATGADTALLNGIQPAVSPDGSTLAYVASVRGHSGSGGLWVQELAGGEPRLVRYEETEYRMKPQWTADGKGFLYVSDESGEHEVRIIAADGGNPTILTADARDEFSPTPSPDGTRFAFVSNRTGPTELYTAPGYGGRHSAWEPVQLAERRAGQPTGRVRLRVLGPAGTVVPARVYIDASDGRSYSPEGGFHRVMAATERHYFHTWGESEVVVPAGRTRIEVLRGHEYRPVAAEVTVAAGGIEAVTLRLERLLDLPALGWYSGDTHVHDLHQGRFGLDHEAFYLQLTAEDLHLTNALIHMDGTRIMGRWDDLTGEPHPLSTDDHILQYAQEYRGSLGHIASLGVDEFFLPFTGGAGSTAYAQPTLDLGYIDAAREQGGIAGFVHPFTSIVEEPGDAANSLIALDVALGRGDFYDIGALFSDEIASAEFYYRLLNAGFRIAATGGTDNFSDVWRDPPPGSDRTYVQITGPLTVQNWLDGVVAQRTFMSTGPLLLLEVEGRSPGEEVAVAANAAGSVEVEVTAVSIAPMDRLEIVVNGDVVETVESRDSLRIEFSGSVPVPAGGWVVARVIGPPSKYVGDSYAYAHTSPVYVVRGGAGFVSAEDATFLAASVDALWARVEDSEWRTDAERDAFRAAAEEAAAVYRGIAARGSSQ
ncbi:MAG: CehA/McbA family metallohydrolase [Gemmatimonadota bacterium]